MRLLVEFCAFAEQHTRVIGWSILICIFYGFYSFNTRHVSIALLIIEPKKTNWKKIGRWNSTKLNLNRRKKNLAEYPFKLLRIDVVVAKRKKNRLEMVFRWKKRDRMKLKKNGCWFVVFELIFCYEPTHMHTHTPISTSI